VGAGFLPAPGKEPSAGATDAGDTLHLLDHDPNNRIMIPSLCLSMIFSENRFPLFRIMLQAS
jgi:hypothetical protein